MFTKFNRLGRIATLAVLAAAALPAAAAGAETAQPVCEPKISSQVFALFGDTRDYYLAPGGDFEGSVSWAKSGAVSLSAQIDPFALAGLRDAGSAWLQNGGKITSPKLCVTRDEPFMRFVARHAGGGQLDVIVRNFDADGRVSNTSSGSISPSDHWVWAPSRLVDLLTGDLDTGYSGYVDIQFKSQGDWKIDDVFIDPYRR